MKHVQNFRDFNESYGHSYNSYYKHNPSNDTTPVVYIQQNTLWYSWNPGSGITTKIKGDPDKFRGYFTNDPNDETMSNIETNIDDIVNYIAKWSKSQPSVKSGLLLYKIPAYWGLKEPSELSVWDGPVKPDYFLFMLLSTFGKNGYIINFFKTKNEAIVFAGTPVNEAIITDPNIKEQIGTFYDLQNQIQKLESELSAKRSAFKQFEKDVKPLIDGMKEFGDKLAETEDYLIKVNRFGGDRLDVSYKVAFESALSKVNGATKKVLAEALEASKKITQVKHGFDIHKVSEASFFDKIKEVINDLIFKILGVFKKEGTVVDVANRELRDLQKTVNESEYKKIPYNMKIAGTYEVSSRLYQAIVRVAGFERHDDSNDSLYLMDDDKSKPIFGSFIVKNSDMPKLQKGIIVNAETTKGEDVKIKRIGDI